jgi:acyl carrier protein
LETDHVAPEEPAQQCPRQICQSPYNRALSRLPWLSGNSAICYRLRHSEILEGENIVMASAAEDIVEMITGRISPTSGALQLSEPLDKLGLDSMQVVELIFDIEEKFDIQIPLNANMDIESKTVGDLIQAVDQLVAAKAKPN